MPFQKNFPSLGPTKRLRIPEQVAADFELILDHLDRQKLLFGQDYIESFLSQIRISMDKLEHRKNDSNYKLDEIQSDISKNVHVYDDSLFHHSRECSSTIKRNVNFRRLTDDEVSFCKSSIIECFSRLKIQLNISGYAAWKLVENGLLTRGVSLTEIELYHEICFGYLNLSDKIVSPRLNIPSFWNPIVETLWGIPETRTFEQLYTFRQLIVEINQIRPSQQLDSHEKFSEPANFVRS